MVLNKDGSFQKTFAFRGVDLDAASEEMIMNFSARLNNVFKRFNAGWVIYIEAWRVPTGHYLMLGHFPDPVSFLVDAERREQFESESVNFESYYYLTLQYLPPSEQLSWINKYWMKQNDLNEKYYRHHLDIFLQETDRFLYLVNDIFYTVHAMEDEETLSYLHSTISHNSQPVAMPTVPCYLDQLLIDTPLTGGISPKLGEKYLGILSVCALPSHTFPAMLDKLNQLPMPYRWMTRFIPLDKSTAERQIKATQRRWFSKRKSALHLLKEVFTKQETRLQDTAAVSYAADAEEASQSAQQEAVTFGYYTATIVVTASEKTIVNEKLHALERIVHGAGFVSRRETVNAVEAWLSSLPGHAYANLRKYLVHSLNALHLMPFSAAWSGPEKNKHLKDSALMQCHASGGSSFRYVNHVQDVGHQMIIGPTGSGKSVLLNMIALQFRRYQGARIYIFDKGESFLASTHGVGGEYYHLALHDKTALHFQPLMHIDQEEEQQWAMEWLQGLLVNENVILTSELKNILWQGLTALAEVPVSQRTLTGLCAFLQNKLLRETLSIYTAEGPFGYLFDASHENIHVSNWQCFEMEALMNQSSIIGPVLSYLFHRLSRYFQGEPTLIILDEAWRFLNHPVFSNKINDWLKGLRKLNVSVVFATQSIDDVMGSSITSTLLESCPSRVLLPNARAMEAPIKATYQHLGLNEKQIQLLSMGETKKQYYYQSSQGNRLFELNLGPIAKCFCAVSHTEEKRHIKQLRQRYGKQKFLEKYLKYKHLSWVWEMITNENSV